MTGGPEAAPGGPDCGPGIVMHGESHNASTFRQTGIEVNILPQALAMPAVRYSLPPDAAAFTGREEELDKVTAAASATGAGGVVAGRRAVP